MAGLNVLICGGGSLVSRVCLRLRRLAGERIELTLVSPEEELVCRPLAVRDPFALEGVHRYPLERIASDTGAKWIQDRLERIDVDARTMHTEGGRGLSYDACSYGAVSCAPSASNMLDEAAVELHKGVVARVPATHLVIVGETRLEVERIVTLPRITGPAVPGLPAGTDWFLPVDQRCRVEETNGRGFAAGDATDFPVKHGGIGAQQADTAAAGIAHLPGCGERPPPFDPVIRGMLLTGDRPLYLTAHVIAGLGWRSEIYEQPPWPADEKVLAEELGPYLASLDAASGPHR
jgi:hypothetical protein